MDQIIQKHEELSHKLNIALSTMERKSVIYELRKELRELQNICPHFSAEHNFAIIDGYCPYCGKKLEEVRNDKGY
jgi:Zn finger protein HypA/HybF involved in hydrogenase expression